MIYIVALLLSFSIALTLIPKILLISVRKRLLDVPDARKVHRSRASRLGGTVFFPGVFFSLCVIGIYYYRVGVEEAVDVPWLILSLGASFLMYIVGAVDDIKGVRCRVKVAYQILTASMIVLSGTWVNSLYGLFGIYELPVWVGIPFTMVLVVFIINAINLIDGIDGLSSGLGILALTAYFSLSCQRGDVAAAILCAATMGVLLGFFRFNFWGFGRHQIKIFMGDSGSLFLGAVISILTLRLLYCPPGVNYYNGPGVVLLTYSVLLVPCLDVLRVMLFRYRVGKPMFRPDKSHIHHKLLSSGFSAAQALFLLLGFTAGITVGNLLLSSVIRVEYVLLVDVLVWGAFNSLIAYRIQKRLIKYEGKKQYQH